MLRNFKNLHDCALAASDGEIGKVREIYFDDEQWKVRYFLVTTGSWLTGREVLIAPRVVEGIDEINSTLAVNLTQEEVRESPPVSSDKPVSRQYEESMYQYYGWDPYWSFSSLGMGYGMPINQGVLPNEGGTTAPSNVTNHLRSSGEISGYRIHATDEELGKVEDFIIDDVSWSIRYLVVRPGNWTTHAQVLLAPEWIKEISFKNAEVVVSLGSEQIKNAPVYDSEVPITRDYENLLHTHYDRKAYWVSHLR